MRLFIAVDLPDPIRTPLLALMKRGTTIPGVRWLNPDGLHLTLKFLGDTSTNLLPELKTRLAYVSSRFFPFSLSLEGCGVFPHEKKPRAFWVGVKGDMEILKKIAREVENSLSEIGFSKENRDFRPHITVGRAKNTLNRREYVTDSKQFCTLFANYRSSLFEVSVVHLIQSHLERDGARYEILDSFHLRNP